jgi:hypothetical protein
MKLAKFMAACALLAFASACGGGGSMGTGGNPTLSLTLTDGSGTTTSSATAFQGQGSTALVANVVVTGSAGTVTLSVSGLPTGSTDQILPLLPPGNSWNIVFSAGTAAADTYPVVVTASDGSTSGSADLSLIIGAAAVISNGSTGPFSVAMSTSFQPAEWDYQFFTQNPSATTTLGNLGPKHIRLQGISQGVPQGTQGSASTTWNFSVLDGITQPVLSVGDHSPEFQIAKAPPFMYSGNDNSADFLDTTFAQFAGYTQNLVKYYNTGGFTSDSTTYVSPAFPGAKITWWGIYNEPNINNNLTPQQYTDMYNAVVPAMQSADPTIKVAALELADFYQQPQNWVPTFVSGVTAHVDVMATHFYSSCNQKDSDATIMDTIPGFVSDVQFFHTQMATNPALANVPVWVTENNVNADYSTSTGMSACNPTQAFVDDLRGSSAFFAAWRPYIFSQFGKNDVQALYHWDFDADPQFGEVSQDNGALQLSYWVDYWLGLEFPATAGSQILPYAATDDAELETLPVKNSDGSVVVMVANHAVNSSTDNNGPGSSRSVLVDVSALGAFSSANLVIIDKDTSVTAGPTPSTVAPAGQITITLNGYAVGFLTLKP